MIALLFFLLPIVTGTPVCQHRSIPVDVCGETEITLSCFQIDLDKKGTKSIDNVKYRITGFDLQYGTVHDLSQPYSKYGFDPKIGTEISPNSMLTDARGRFFYVLPCPGGTMNEMYGHIEYEAIGVTGEISNKANLTITPKDGKIVSSDFLFGSEGWTVVGNKRPEDVNFEPYTMDLSFSRYVAGQDRLLVLSSTDSFDKALWYFMAPHKYYGNKIILYKGQLSFSMMTFSGDFSSTNLNRKEGGHIPFLELICKDCEGPVTQGIRLIYPLEKVLSIMPNLLTGKAATVNINLDEFSNWVKDPQNDLETWPSATRCDFMEVLGRLSALKVLGDFTKGNENVGIDSVSLKNPTGEIPLCVMSKADGSLCSKSCP